MGESIFLLILLAICGVFFYLTFGFKVSILDTSGGAALFPRIVILFLAAVLVVRLMQLMRAGERRHFVFSELFKGYRLFFLLALTGYILLFKPLGYILSTSLFLLVTVNVFYRASKREMGSARSILIRNGVAIAFAVGLYLFFAKVVHIMLPAGVLG